MAASQTSPFIPNSVEEWAKLVREDPTIEYETPQFTSRGRERDLSVTDTTYNSGSGISGSEFLHLRVIWRHYKQINDLGHMIKDSPDLSSPYRGYVSPQNLHLATRVYDSCKTYWKAYLDDIASGTDSLRPSRDCRDWRAARYYQTLTMKHTKESREVSDDQIVRASKVRTCQGQPSSHNKSLGTPQAALGRSPMVTNYAMGGGNRANTPSADEAYPNTALLLLLQAVTFSVGGLFSDMDWLAPRIPLKLTHTVIHPSRFGKDAKEHIELLQAQVDGYLCKRNESGQMNQLPLAICEAKPFVRISALTQIQRQEGAEMACWINKCRDDTGLLRSSASGRKRRLLISQDRHEIFIVIGEYGSKYEDYIRPISDQRSAQGKGAQKQNGPVKPGATEEERAGSAGYNNQMKDKGVILSEKPPKVMSKSARVNAKKPDPNLPAADEFLFMHQFGPFLTQNAQHMDAFIRRLIALMLELKAGSINPDDLEKKPKGNPASGSGSKAGPSSGGTTRLPVRTANVNTRSSTRRDNTPQPQPPQPSSSIPKPSPKKKTAPAVSTSSRPVSKPAGGPSSSSGPSTPAQQQPQARERPQMSAAEKTVHTDLLKQTFSEPRRDFLEQEPIRGVKKARSLPRRNVAQDQPWENFDRH